MCKLTYNNRLLYAEERDESCRISDEYINEFSECIEGLFQLAKEVPLRTTLIIIR